MARDRTLLLGLALLALLAALAALLAGGLGGGRASGVPAPLGAGGSSDAAAPGGSGGAAGGLPGGASAPGTPAVPPPSLPGEARPGVHGRVVEATTGEGLAGFELVLASGSHRLESGRSASDGGFRFARGTVRATRLGVTAPPGYVVDERELELDRPRQAGDAPVVVTARRAVPLGVAGRLVDAATGAPLAAFALKLGRSGRGPELLETDARGRFRSRSPLAAGPARVELVDALGLSRPLATRLAELAPRPLDPRAPLAELELADVPVVVGPTYRVTLAPLVERADGDSGEELDAPGLGSAAAPEPAALLTVLAEARLEPGWSGSAADVARAGLEEGWNVAPVRGRGEGAPGSAWVRFASPPPALSPAAASAGARPEGADCELVLRDRAGLWVASAPVSGAPGEHVVTLVPRRTARLEGRVLDAAGTPRAEVELRLGAGAGGVRRTTSDAEGRFELGWLPPGRHVVRASPPGAAAERARTEEVTLEAGATARVELVLEGPRRLGAVSGTLRSQSGASRSPSVLRLLALDGRAGSALDGRAGGARAGGALEGGPLDGRAAAPLVTARVAWQRADTGWVGTFRFEDVPHGRYELALAAAPYGHRWSPPRRVVEPPARDVDFVLEDEAPLARLGFRVLDAESGVELERFALVTHPAPAGAALADGDERDGDGDPKSDGDGDGARAAAAGWLAHGSAASGAVALEVAPGRALDWLVLAEGYQPARGDRADFAPTSGTADGPTELCTLRLARGFGAVAVAVDERGAPVAGVEVLDGEGAVLGTTGAGGWVHLARDAAPERLAVRRAGFALAGGNVRADGAWSVHNGVLWIALAAR